MTKWPPSGENGHSQARLYLARFVIRVAPMLSKHKFPEFVSRESFFIEQRKTEESVTQKALGEYVSRLADSTMNHS